MVGNLRPCRVVGLHNAEEQTMPWTSQDAEKHTHKADTRDLRELWAKIANETLELTGDDARAIREANAVVARQEEK